LATSTGGWRWQRRNCGRRIGQARVDFSKAGREGSVRSWKDDYNYGKKVWPGFPIFRGRSRFQRSVDKERLFPPTTGGVFRMEREQIGELNRWPLITRGTQSGGRPSKLRFLSGRTGGKRDRNALDKSSSERTQRSGRRIVCGGSYFITNGPRSSRCSVEKAPANSKFIPPRRYREQNRKRGIILVVGRHH